MAAGREQSSAGTFGAATNLDYQRGVPKKLAAQRAEQRAAVKQKLMKVAAVGCKPLTAGFLLPTPRTAALSAPSPSTPELSTPATSTHVPSTRGPSIPEPSTPAASIPAASTPAASASDVPVKLSPEQRSAARSQAIVSMDNKLASRRHGLSPQDLNRHQAVLRFMCFQQGFEKKPDRSPGTPRTRAGMADLVAQCYSRGKSMAEKIVTWENRDPVDHQARDLGREAGLPREEPVMVSG